MSAATCCTPTPRRRCATASGSCSPTGAPRNRSQRLRPGAARLFGRVAHAGHRTRAWRASWCPSQLGGAGASAREAAVVMEEIGRAVAPVPFLSSAVLATVALLRAGDTETLPALAQGGYGGVGGPAVDRTGRSGYRCERRRRRADRTVTSVAGADAADVLVVPVAGPDGLELHTVSRDAAGVDSVPAAGAGYDETPCRRVTFRDRHRRGSAPAAASRVAAALETAAALLASEQLGVAQWCFDTTLEYVRQRKQFGRTIGSYQAIKHRLADLWLEVGSAAAAARYAADTSARGDEDAPSRRQSRRPTAAMWPCMPPRNASSCMAASG